MKFGTPTVQPQPNRQYYGENEIALLDTYNSRAAFEQAAAAAGVQITLPPFNPAMPIKRWVDLTATVDPTDPDAVKPYLIVRATAPESGVYIQKTVYMSPQEARTANIPDEGTNIPGGTNPTRPVPLRKLLDTERLVPEAFGDWRVERTDLAQAADLSSGKFLASDRAMLQAIYDKTMKGA